MEIADLLPTILKLLKLCRRFAVATVLSCEGSTPVRPGAKAVIGRRGVLAGTVGGGLAEAETQRRAASAIRSGRAAVFEVDLSGAGNQERSAVCGGRMRVLVDPTAAQFQDVYAQAGATLERRKFGVWLTTLRGGESPEISVEWVEARSFDSHLGFPSADDIRHCGETAAAKLFTAPCSPDTAEEVLVFVEPWIPKPQLIIVGGGHVGQAVAVQAQLVGFEIVVIDDRPEFTESRLFPAGTRTLCGPLGETLSKFPRDPDSYVVIVTPSSQQDAAALAAVWERPARYVGLMGSRRKIRLLRQALVESGTVTEDEFDRVYAPIGLNIGAVTVPEIATSIVAQLIAVRRGRPHPLGSECRLSPVPTA